MSSCHAAGTCAGRESWRSAKKDEPLKAGSDPAWSTLPAHLALGGESMIIQAAQVRLFAGACIDLDTAHCSPVEHLAGRLALDLDGKR